MTTNMTNDAERALQYFRIATILGSGLSLITGVVGTILFAIDVRGMTRSYQLSLAALFTLVSFVAYGLSIFAGRGVDAMKRVLAPRPTSVDPRVD